MMFQLSRTTWHGSVVLAIALAAVGGRSRAWTLEPPVATVVERAGRYVENYEKEFSAVVCEEQQAQTLVRPDGTVRKRRELRSDFLLVKTGSAWMHAFRDVMEVDGKPVRDRRDRLRKLFLEAPKTAVEQAQAIAKESGRFVPTEMQERYWRPQKPGDDRLEVTSSYSNFRRFQVTVDEQIRVPK